MAEAGVVVVTEEAEEEVVVVMEEAGEEVAAAALPLVPGLPLLDIPDALRITVTVDVTAPGISFFPSFLLSFALLSLPRLSSFLPSFPRTPANTLTGALHQDDKSTSLDREE